MATDRIITPRRSVAVTIGGAITVLDGLVYTVLGASLLLAGQAMATASAGGWEALLELLGGMLAIFGAVFVLQGMPMVVAGIAVLYRRRWGEVMTLVMAVIAVLWGVVALSAYAKGTGYVIFGACQMVYAILAFVLLTKHGAEFQKPLP